MYKNIILFSVVTGLLPFCYAQPSKTYYNDRVFVVSIPKSGTHLITKCLTLFDKPGLEVTYQKFTGTQKDDTKQCVTGKLNKLSPPNNYKGRLNVPAVGVLPEERCQKLSAPTAERLFANHWPYTREFEDFLQDKVAGIFFMIRDPRDMLVSLSFMVNTSSRLHKTIAPLSLMKDFINASQKHYISWGVEKHAAYPLMFDKGVIGFYKMYLPWIQARKVMTVRFEDLVGSKGGGDDTVQYNTIKAMAKHIGEKLSDKEIKHIQENLFGGSATFRKGLIGGWKEHFTKEMKDAFKKVPGACQLLIDLGYEKDSGW